MLRSLIYDSNIRNHIRIVMAGSGHLLDLHKSGSPLHNASKTYFLEAFEEEAARVLINQAPGIPKPIADEIFNQCGGHPFILQHILHYIAEGEISSVTKDTIGSEIRRFIHDRHSDLEGWWYALGDDGQQIYYILATSTSWMTHADIIQTANNSTLHINLGLDALCYHGFAIHDGTYKKFSLSGLLFRDWALEEHQTYKS